MRYAIYTESTGQITSVYTGLLPAENIGDGQGYLAIDDSINLARAWVSDTGNPAIDALPSQPTDYHQFDYQLRSWVLTNDALDKAKNKLVADIEQYADYMHNSAIEYDSKSLDADPVARENISGKVNQLKAEIELSISSANLFWKDADNVVHSWTSATVYLEWLQGLMIAIASRRTNLYALVWQAKADVAALTDIADVLAFDVTAVFA